MKATTPFRFCSAWYGLIITLTVVLALAGCGDSSLSASGESGGGTIVAGVGVGGTGVVKLAAPVEPATISGLVNVVVFLDKNGNQRPDEGEPTTRTDENGTYNLTLDPVDAQRYPVVMLAQEGVTINKATGTPVTSSYVVRQLPPTLSAQ